MQLDVVYKIPHARAQVRKGAHGSMQLDVVKKIPHAQAQVEGIREGK